jgi:sulfur-oxidizing protein SoxB
MDRREFLQVLGAASAAGMALSFDPAHAQSEADRLYEMPRFGQVSLLHFTDCHAQLLPVHFREPNVNLGIGTMAGQPPHLVGAKLLAHYGIRPGGHEAHAFGYEDFARLARLYGKVGGFAHLASLVKRVRASRPGAVLLDGGDTWQGSGTSLWSKGQDMVDAAKLLGVDVMTLHWECTYGHARVLEIAEKDFAGKIDIVAQNIKTVDAARAAGAKVVVLLSHNGMDVDLKMAARVRGIDAILGGHTHDGMPAPTVVANGGGKTIVTNAGSNGKFLGVLDLEVGAGGVAGWRYKLMPVFADLLPADREMAALIEQVRAPHAAKLGEKLATSEGLLYRRGNFNGSFDQLICEALMAEKDAEIALSPGFRWGTTVLPGEAITMDQLLDQTAITYPFSTLTEMTGETLKAVLEDVCDNLFNPDPYQQQGGDMVRVGGLTYACDPTAAMGGRIRDMRVRGRDVEPSGRYKVAGWAPVSGEARDAGGEPIWDLVARHLRSRKTVAAIEPNLPRLVGMESNPGFAR